MNAPASTHGERARSSAGEERSRNEPQQIPAKVTRSAGEAPQQEPPAEPQLEAREADAGEAEAEGADAHAGDWELTAELLAAMGLEAEEGVEGEAGEEGAGGAGGAGESDAPEDAPVRRKASAAAWANEAPLSGSDTDIARAGFTGSPAASFPHREAIERSFGTSLPATAYTGEAASQSSAALGADGYALGSQVAFASSAPGLELAAHEAAHVMQATSGVQLHGGEGVYEDHADAVAARVVRGESASDLLVAGPVASPSVRRGKHNRRRRRQQQGRQVALPGGREQLKTLVKKLRSSLRFLIQKAEWKEIRKTANPRESAPGIERAQQRRSGDLPDLKGLGKISVVDRFAAAMKGIQEEWQDQAPKERLTAISLAINEELENAGVPKLLRFYTADEDCNGAFGGENWEMQLSGETMQSPSLTNAVAGLLCNTVLHEARHAEQTFLAARYAAGPAKNMTAQQIAREQSIPLTIARKAVLQKFDHHTVPQVEALGESMYESNVTNGEENLAIGNRVIPPQLAQARRRAIVALNALNERADRARILFAVEARRKVRGVIAEVERRYAAYRNIPSEMDAHDVGDSAELAFQELQ